MPKSFSYKNIFFRKKLTITTFLNKKMKTKHYALNLLFQKKRK